MKLVIFAASTNYTRGCFRLEGFEKINKKLQCSHKIQPCSHLHPIAIFHLFPFFLSLKHPYIKTSLHTFILHSLAPSRSGILNPVFIFLSPTGQSKEAYVYKESTNQRTSQFLWGWWLILPVFLDVFFSFFFHFVCLRAFHFHTSEESQSEAATQQGMKRPRV